MAHKLKLDGFIAERIFNKPLLLEPSKARIISNYLETRFFDDVTIQGMDSVVDVAPDGSGEPSMQIFEGVAIIPIIGTLVQRGGFMDAQSGMLSYQVIRSQLIEAAENPNVKSILLDIDSGGGEVEGNFDIARLIRQINDEHKPVVAIANGSAFSGAFSIGVSAGSFYVTETGGVGSVGVIIQHMDISKNNEMNGIKITNIVAGDRKAELSPDLPLSDSGKEMLQNEVNRIGDMFVSLVASMRGISENSVKATKASLLFGNESVNIGFVDGMISFENLLEGMIGINSPMGSIGMKQRIENMFLKKKKETAKIESEVVESTEVPVPAEQPAAEDDAAPVVEPTDEAVETVSNEADKAIEDAAAIVDVCTEASMGHLAAGFIRSKTSLDDVKKSVDFKKEVTKICTLAGKPDLAAGYLESGKTLKAIQDDLISKLASAQTEISNKPDPDAVNKDLSSAKNVIEADLERRSKLNQTKKGV